MWILEVENKGETESTLPGWGEVLSTASRLRCQRLARARLEQRGRDPRGPADTHKQGHHSVSRDPVVLKHRGQWAHRYWLDKSHECVTWNLSWCDSVGWVQCFVVMKLWGRTRAWKRTEHPPEAETDGTRKRSTFFLWLGVTHFSREMMSSINFTQQSRQTLLI